MPLKGLAHPDRYSQLQEDTEHVSVGKHTTAQKTGPTDATHTRMQIIDYLSEYGLV